MTHTQDYDFRHLREAMEGPDASLASVPSNFLQSLTPTRERLLLVGTI